MEFYRNAFSHGLEKANMIDVVSDKKAIVPANDKSAQNPT